MKNVSINFDVKAIIKQLQPEIKKKLVKMATDNFNEKTAHLHDEIAAEGGT